MKQPDISYKTSATSMYNGKKNVRILIVEDDEDDFYLTSQLIKSIPQAKEWTTDWCYNYKDALQRICNKEYDIFFIDYFLGGRTGLELLKEAIANNCHSPIIMLTGIGNQAIDVEAMRNGATDYLVKGELNPENLERAIRYAMEKTEVLNALRLNEQKYRTIFEQSKDAIFLMDGNLRFLTVNNATNQLLGYGTEELMASSVLDTLADKAMAVQLFSSFQMEGEVNDAQIEIVCKNGSRRICLFSAFSIKGIGDETVVQGLLRDISQVRQAERNVVMLEKMAVAGRLVQLLAHEIRNPLTNISLSAEELQKDEGENSGNEYIGIITRNTMRINDILTRLIRASMPTEATLTKVSLQSVLDDAITAAADRINLKNVMLDLHYPRTAVNVLADKTKLSIAFLNIITNSIEAMERDKGRLGISISANGPECEVKIEDNGCGISDEDKKKLFEPYFTSKRNGLGVGLSATLNILQSHSAKAQVDSKVGAGTSFTVTMLIAD